MESVTLPTLALRKLPGINPTMHTNVQDKVATVKVVAPKTDENPTGYIVINKTDLTDKHKVYDGADYAPAAAAEGQPAQAQFSQSDLDAAVAAAVDAALAKRDEAAKAAAK